MISVEFVCDHANCNEGSHPDGRSAKLLRAKIPADESVDVYAPDWHGRSGDGVPTFSGPTLLNQYLPEGWIVRTSGDPFTGYALVYCPTHADEHRAHAVWSVRP